MNTLLVMTVGQTDVQLIEGDARRELSKEKCASLHDEIERRAGEWSLADSPISKLKPAADSLPQGPFTLCTPKLDAMMKYAREKQIAPTAALILATRRDAQAERGDPRYAGTLVATRLRELGLSSIRQAPFLTGEEHLEDPKRPRDAIIRHEVVNRIDEVLRTCIEEIKPTQVIVATTGGFPTVSNLVEEIVRLRAAPAAARAFEILDRSEESPPAEDQAIERHWISDPSSSYQARRHALGLIENGNLLGAWGAVQHLAVDDVEHRWTKVVDWLGKLAASRPIPPECDIDLLKSGTRMAVRAALRVELALRAGDIPRAVHGTVAFFESALWDHLNLHLTPHGGPRKYRQYRLDPSPAENLIRQGDGSSEERRRPFELVEEDEDGVRWYRVFDDDICGVRLAKHYLKQASLEKLGQSVSRIRDLRNDVAHNEPTPQLIDDARRRMIEACLWSEGDRFLIQPLVQNVLQELGGQNPESLCSRLLAQIRERLLTANRS